MNTTVMKSKVEKKKQNSVVKDENGFYRVKLGRLNTYNSNGVFYKVNNLEALLSNPKSVIHRRIENGLLKAEVKHPKFTDANGYPLQGDALIQAIFEIDLDNVCASIKKVEFIKTNKTETGWSNFPIYEVFGWVKPIEPKGHYIKDALEDPDINLAWSIRSAVTEDRIGGMLVRTIIDISVWDYVDEGGVDGSSQWTAAGVEKKDYTSFDDTGIVCLDGSCLNKLKKISHGTENSNIEGIIDNIDKMSNTVNDKFFNL